MCSSDLSWFQPVRRMRDLANGQAADLMRESVEKMRKDKLSISAPRSIEKVFLSLFGEQNLSIQSSKASAEYDPFASFYTYLEKKESGK